MRQGGLILASDRVRSNKKKIEKKIKYEKIRRTQNTPRNLQQPVDCDRLETVRDETRPTPASMDLGFVEVVLVQLSQEVNTADVTHTERQADRQTN